MSGSRDLTEMHEIGGSYPQHTQ